MASDRGVFFRTRGARRLATIALALAALCFQGRAALAEPTSADRETARNLLKEGDEKFAAKDFAGAIKAYQAAHSIMQLPTTGLALAKAQIEKGFLVEARDTLLQVSRLSKEPGEKPVQGQARDEATQLAGKIADRIPSLLITVDGPPADSVTVTVDGAVVPPATLGAARKVNPGSHTIVATAAGYQTTTRILSIKEGDNEKVALALKSGSGTATTTTTQNVPVKAGGARIHVESPSEPGNVIVDGKAAGATPLDVPVAPGSHKVEIEYPGGSSDLRSVDVAAGGTADVKFAPSQLDAIARHRKGLHFGFAAAPTMVQYLEGGGQPYGGMASFVLHVGITPTFEFRSGITAGFMYRGDDRLAQITAVVPAMLRINLNTWFAMGAGLSAGFVGTFRPAQGTADAYSKAGGAIGPEWTLFTMLAGEKRQYEVSFAQGLRFGDTSTEYHQSLVFTYLLLD